MVGGVKATATLETERDRRPFLKFQTIAENLKNKILRMFLQAQILSRI